MKKWLRIATALFAGSLLVIGAPASQAATTKPTPKPTISVGVAGDSNNGRGTQFKAFRDCLTKHGVAVTTPGKPGTRTPGTQPKLDAKTQKAYTACASLRPKGGFSGGFRTGGTEFTAFVSCMKDHKVTVRTPSFAPKTTTTPNAGSTSKTKPSLAPSPGGQERGRGGILASLNQKDPKVAEALKICGALLPAQN